MPLRYRAHVDRNVRHTAQEMTHSHLLPQTAQEKKSAKHLPETRRRPTATAAKKSGRKKRKATRIRVRRFRMIEQ